MLKKSQWLILASFLCSMTMLTSCKDDDNDSSAGDNEGTVEIYDPSTYWVVSDKVAYMEGIESMPADFQTALKQRFPNQTATMEEAQVVFVDMDKYNYDYPNMTEDEVKEASEFIGKLIEMEIEHGAAIVMLSSKGNITYGDAIGSMEGWDKIFMATHGQGDSYFLLDEKDDADPIVANQINDAKDASYWNTRLSHFVEWLNDYDAEQEEISKAAASRMHRADKTDSSPFEEVKMSLSTGVQRIVYNMPFELNCYIDQATWSDPDWLYANSTVSVQLRITPMYMLSANGDYAGDYYYVRSCITPHNQEMWRPFIRNHGGTQIRVYGYWLDYMYYNISLVNKDGSPVDGVEYFDLPIPQNKIGETEYSQSYSIGLEGSLSAGSSKKQGEARENRSEASVGFSANWSESISYRFTNVAYSRNTSTPAVTYTWYTSNVELDDEWDNMWKHFKPDTHDEFDCENIWMWHVNPTASNGIADNSTANLNIAVNFKFSYSSWYHWRAALQYDNNKKNHLVNNPLYSKIPVTPPNRETWGLIEVTNISDYTMRNVKILKNGKLVKAVDGTYAKDKAATAALKEGTYSITFEYINPNTNKVIKRGTFNKVVVKMGRDKASATTKLSTGTATLK